MALIHIIKTKYANGSEEVRKVELDFQEIIIGRGADCQLRLDSDKIDLQHARLSFSGESLEIEDLGSLGGTWQNEQSIKKAQLSAGDTLRLGDTVLEVDLENSLWSFKESRAFSKSNANHEEELNALVDSLDLKKRLPSILSISLVLVLAIVFFFFYQPIYSKQQDLWNSGPISKSHQFIASDCSTCHLVPFEKVQDVACLSCHQMEHHGDSDLEDCASCHMEHNGDDGLIFNDSRTCASCHGNINSHSILKSKLKDVKSFNKHPKFTLPESDISEIKLNHRIHLQKNLRRSDGTLETLNCSSCHDLSQGRNPLPITYEKNCSSCHSLSFDERLAQEQVPHGDENEVFKYLYASYAKLYLAEDGVEREELRKRMRPGGEIPREEEIAFLKEEVFKISRKAEKELFEKTTCNLCHEVQEKDLILENNLQESNYTIQNPRIPSTWFSKARFDHRAHDFSSCSTCHSGVSKSTLTSEVLLPQVEDCQSCHGDKASKGVMKSDCTLCHSYHDQLSLPVIRKSNWLSLQRDNTSEK